MVMEAEESNTASEFDGIKSELNANYALWT